MDLNLLEKTTFWVDGIELASTDLGRLAAVAASALGLAAEDVMVVDVRPGLVAFDVTSRTVPAEAVTAKETALLERLGAIEGVTLGPGASVHSEGVLGLIASDPVEGARALESSRQMAAEVLQRVARRALVFASGSEVRDGSIRDTNSPFLMDALGRAGFKAEHGGILEDDAVAVAASLEGALSRGYGLVITTGGVGAEDKDHNIEAVLRLDPRAHTPWILRFEPDMKRHHKAGVRIAVGRVGPTMLIALPGPNDEVRLAAGVLLPALSAGRPDHEIAEALAVALRDRWHSRMHPPGESHG
jgi:molybdenum cofactor synthesis domain-containing protein